MSEEIRFEQATMEHADLLSQMIRKEDAEEVMASGGYSPIGALEASIDMSLPNAWAVFFCGELAAIWGFAPFGLMSGAVIPWMITGEAVNRHPKAFVRESKKAVRFLRSRCMYLVNMVDARYVAALRWAKYLGFEVGEEESFGVERRPFRKISMKGDQNV